MTDGAPARLRDVAREAGVSVATASKALNGRHDVSDRTRDLVLAAAARLRFEPDPVARELANRRLRSDR